MAICSFYFVLRGKRSTSALPNPQSGLFSLFLHMENEIRETHSIYLVSFTNEALAYCETQLCIRLLCVFPFVHNPTILVNLDNAPPADSMFLLQGLQQNVSGLCPFLLTLTVVNSLLNSPLNFLVVLVEHFCALWFVPSNVLEVPTMY